MAKTEPTEATEQPAEAAESAADVPEFGTAVRIETFSEDDKWGWRSVTAEGTQVRASSAEFESQREAIKAAKGEDHNDGLPIPDAEPVSASTFTP